MDKIKVSVTNLNNFNYYLLNMITREQLMDRLLGEFKANVDTNIGTAYHYLLEHYEEIKDSKTVNIDNNTYYVINEPYLNYFQKLAVDELINEIEKDGIKPIPEVNGRIEIDNVLITGRVDGLKPNEIIEYKTTGRFQLQWYDNSIQHLLYKKMFDNIDVTYYIAEIYKNVIPSNNKDISDIGGYKEARVNFKSLRELRFVGNTVLEEDRIKFLIKFFKDFLLVNNIYNNFVTK